MTTLDRHPFRAFIGERLAALRALRDPLSSADEAALEAARAEAEALRRAGREQGYPELAAAAAPVLSAPPEVVPKLTLRLLRLLEELVDPAWWQSPAQVLVVEGFSGLGETLRERLDAPNRRVRVATSAAGAERLLEEEGFALVVLDLLLPDLDGRSLLCRLRDDPRTEQVPIVVLADADGEGLRAECFAIGADHFFDHAADPDLLAVAIASTLQRSLSSRRDTSFDPFSRLLGRDGFRRKLRRRLARRAANPTPITLARAQLLILGSDDPKTVPSAGQLDSLLREVAAAVQETLRPKDAVARWQDQELAILLHDTTLEGAERAMRRVRQSLLQRRFGSGRPGLRVDLRVGLAAVEPGADAESALEAADRALLAARGTGAPGASEPIGRGSDRILVLDHEPEVAFVLERRLTREGFRIVRARSADEARAAFDEGAALVFLEARLPGCDSFALLAELRRRAGDRRVPIIMSAHARRGLDVARAFELGADDYVLKPCGARELVARVRHHLRRNATPTVPEPARAGVMTGLFSGDQLFEFVQMLGLNAKTGRLSLSGDALSGTLSFRDGRVVGAWSTHPDRDPLAVTTHLLALESGRFEFRPGPVPAAAKPIATVDSLLLDALRERDERARGGRPR
ncbi:MAG: response regulator [Planctomycetota bacterium]|nr:MAG: response regulator [Planctomycetota bacterium]